jgi:predicted ATPase/class 3 adenylate cyclase
MSTPPSGTVTFLFTDIEGSTKLAQEYPDQWEALRARHNAILQAAVDRDNGYIFQIIGDAVCVAFHSAGDALNAALNAQWLLQNEPWSPAPVKVRMAIHTGAARLNNTSDQIIYLGYTTLVSTQRIVSAGHGGQVLISGATYELVRDVLPANTELLDLGERRLKDLWRPEHLYQLNAAGLSATFPPLNTLDAFLNNLPAQLTSFIGRENEIANIKRELKTHRLVTLTGPGGTGKTRLSLQVAADLLDHFQHGVWFIELAPLTDPDLIPQTILSAIGILEQSGTPPLERLKEYLHEKKSLIVLDNCEHLIEGSAKVADTLLTAVPDLKVLASSREALGVKGEAVYPVPPLSLPDIKHLPRVAQLSQYEAVRLFIERALLIAPHFSVDQYNAPLIAQICHRLDGIPLAIELAAARVKMLSVDQISARLDDRFHLLTGGARTALPRQQTLRALIDWSYDILSESERLLLSRLSVFASGWTLEAAEQVCAGMGQGAVSKDTLSHYEILDLLTQLINKSLIVVIEPSPGKETRDPAGGLLRYRMLETIRQYAHEKLLEAGGSEIVRQGHVTYFVDLVERAEPNLRAFDMLMWLDRLEDELDNIRAVLEWALKSNVETVLRLASALLWFWHIHNHKNEAVGWLEQGLDREAAERGEKPLWPERALLRGKALNAAGFLLRNSEKRITLLQEALKLFHELGISGKQGAATALRILGNCELEKGHYEQARVLAEESLSIFMETKDQFNQAECLNLLVGLAMNEGDFEQAIRLQEEALILRKEIGDKDGMAYALYMLGQIAHSQYDIARAQTLYEESLALFHEIGNRTWVAEITGTLADIASTKGDLPKAVSLIEEGLALARNMDDKYGIAHLMLNLGDAARFQGDNDRASQLYEETMTLSRKMEANNFIAYALYGKAEIARSRKDYGQANLLHQEALAIRQRISHTFGITYSLNALAELAVLQGKARQAVRLFSAIEGLYKRWELGQPPTERAKHDDALVATRDQFDEATFNLLWAEGQKITIEQAIQLALEKVDG